MEVPAGIVSLMFTDIEDSTRHWERLGDRFHEALARHNRLVQEAIDAWRGYAVKCHGDSFMVAFARAGDAVQCAVAIQRALSREPWAAELGEVRVRIGIHSGEAFPCCDALGRPDYVGSMVNRAARIGASGHGGQVLISAATRDMLRQEAPADILLDDLGRHRLRGSEHPEQLFAVRHPDLPEQLFPPLRSVEAPPTNLPVQLTSFVGRGRELEQSHKFLDHSECRLLTLTGPGGVGKTRLALRLAAEMLSFFVDGVWLVSLAEVTEPEQVAPEIAAAMDLPLQPGRSAQEQLLAYLSPRALLLVLDNFERVLGASLLVAEILRTSPEVRCVVTSQVALRLRGEQTYHLGPLALPEEGVCEPEDLARTDSVALFVDRARAVRPGFELTDKNAAVVAEICRGLEGSPLAIELAGAQVADMSPPEVLAGLGFRLDGLVSDSPDRPERHRTLRAAVEWSYQLLGPADQRALQCLSVFARGCSREAIRAVLGEEAAEAVRTLCRHSLLNRTESPSGRSHYVLPETIREYARERLGQHLALAEEVRARHAAHYLGFAEEKARKVRTQEEATSLDELWYELDNLRAAMEHAGSVRPQEGARKVEQPEVCARLALALAVPLHRRGFWEEAHEVMVAGARAASASGDSSLAAAAEYHLASLRHDMGRLDLALAGAGACLELRRELGDPSGIAEALNLLGLLRMDAGVHETARLCFEEALSLLPAEEHVRRGNVLHNLARLTSQQGASEEAPDGDLGAARRAALEEARRLNEQALHHRRLAGDARGEAESLGNLGVVAQKLGDHTQAQRLYTESLELSRTLRDPHRIGIMLNNLAEIAERREDWAEAARLFSEAEEILGRLNAADVAEPRKGLARIEALLGRSASHGR